MTKEKAGMTFNQLGLAFKSEIVVKFVDMRTYELVLVLKSSLSSEQRKKLVDTIKGWLKNVKVAKEEDWGQKPLSYKIKRETNGYYTVLALETEGSVPTDFEKRIINQENVLRHLLIRRK